MLCVYKHNIYIYIHAYTHIYTHICIKLATDSAPNKDSTEKGNEYIFSVLTPGRQYMASALRMLHRPGDRNTNIQYIYDTHVYYRVWIT